MTFNVTLIGGPMDGANAKVEMHQTPENPLEDGELEFNGHKYFVTFADSKAKYMGVSV